MREAQGSKVDGYREVVEQHRRLRQLDEQIQKLIDTLAQRAKQPKLVEDLREALRESRRMREVIARRSYRDGLEVAVETLVKLTKSVRVLR